jgi:hypothetical protein
MPYQGKEGGKTPGCGEDPLYGGKRKEHQSLPSEKIRRLIPSEERKKKRGTEYTSIRTRLFTGDRVALKGRVPPLL